MQSFRVTSPNAISPKIILRHFAENIFGEVSHVQGCQYLAILGIGIGLGAYGIGIGPIPELSIGIGIVPISTFSAGIG